jgi:hypothetical protein
MGQEHSWAVIAEWLELYQTRPRKELYLRCTHWVDFGALIKKAQPRQFALKGLSAFASSRALIARRFRLLFLPTRVIHVTTATRGQGEIR